MELLQLGKIDGLAVEAEGPGEGGHDEADGDHAPAAVADRHLVDEERHRR